MRSEMSFYFLVVLVYALSISSNAHPAQSADTNLRIKQAERSYYNREDQNYNQLSYNDDDDDNNLVDYPERGSYWNNSQSLSSNSHQFMTKFSNYISNYSSSTLYTWLTYPWYNPSTGLTVWIVFLSCIFGWILISGWTVTNGRGILDSPFLDKDVLNRLTQNILDAIDLLESKHRPKRSEMQKSQEEEAGDPERVSANFGSSSSFPSFSTSVTQSSSWSGYISTILYNCLNWLSLPYPEFIASLSYVALLMVVNTIIAMTQGVFPSTTVSGRSNDNENHFKNGDDKGTKREFESSRVAHSILEAIDLWAQKNHKQKDSTTQD